MTAWLRSVSPSLRPTDESDDESSDENEVSTDDVGDSARSTPQLSSNRTTTPRNLKKLRCITWPQKSAIPFVRERAASKAAEERSASLQVRLRRGQRKIEERRAAAAGEDSRPVVQSHVNLSKEIPNKDIKTPYRVKLREDEVLRILVNNETLSLCTFFSGRKTFVYREGTLLWFRRKPFRLAL